MTLLLFAVSPFTFADEPQSSSAAPPAAQTQPQLSEREQLLAQVKQHRAKKEWEPALAALDKVLAMDRTKGEVSEPVAETLTSIAEVQERKGDWAAAVKSRGEVVRQWEQLTGKESWQAGGARAWAKETDSMETTSKEQKQAWRAGIEALDRADTLLRLRNFNEALESALDAQKCIRQGLGPESLQIAQILSQYVGRCHYSLRDYLSAKSAIELALAIRRKTLPPEHPDTARNLYQLGLAHRNLHDYAAAKYCYEEALEMRRKILPPENSDIAQCLNNLGNVHDDLREYAAAKRCDEEALTIWRKLLPPEHPDIATSLTNLGLVHQNLCDYTAAKRCHEEALTIWRKLLPPEHPDIATSLTNLGNAYVGLRRCAAARNCYEEALAIRYKVLPPEHHDIATSLNALGAVHDELRDHATSKRYHEEALAIKRKSLSPEHPDIATSLNNLGNAHAGLRDHAAAKDCHEEALAIRRKALPPKHLHIASSLNNLANAHKDLRDYDAAKRCYEEALAIWQEVLPPDHLYVAVGHNNLGELALVQNIPSASWGHFAIALPIWRAYLARLASSQDEGLQITAAAGEQSRLDRMLSSITADQARLAHGAALGWKGQVAARQRWQHLVRALSADAQSAALAAELAKANQQMFADRSDAGQNRVKAELALTERVRELEQSLAELSPQFRQQLEERQKGVDPARIAALLPADVVVIDLLRYSHIWYVEGEAKSEERLIAFVIRPNRDVVRVNFGPAEPLEKLVAEWRSSHGSNTTAAAELRKLLWEPIEKHLDGVKLVLVSPDSFLTGLPFAALPGKEPGKFLLHEYAFATIPIPAQLPELLADKDDKTPPSLLLAGDIDFGGTAPNRPLPGTKKELESLRESFQKAYPGTTCEAARGAQATKAAFVKAAPNSRFIHLATHGYFADPSVKNALAPSDKPLSRGFNERMPVEGLHPGLLSGLVFAGANSGKPEDTRLTALEVGDMDLHADLVVLSACETGLGKVAGGEGVLGLQRAFQVAGAKTVLSTLWSVDDDSTQLLMREFYHNLWVKKMSKVEALRQAQLRLLEDGKFTPGSERGLEKPGGESKAGRRSPYYWASFVLSGDWR